MTFFILREKVFCFRFWRLLYEILYKIHGVIFFYFDGTYAGEGSIKNGPKIKIDLSIFLLKLRKKIKLKLQGVVN